MAHHFTHEFSLPMRRCRAVCHSAQIVAQKNANFNGLGMDLGVG